MEADLRQIQQLIFNLVINAGEAIGEEPGMVIVETGVARPAAKGLPAEPPFGRAAAGPVRIRHGQDTGAGMDAAMRARIFDPFFSTKFTGRGLGLAAAHGNRARPQGYDSRGERAGKGSQFEVLLPRRSRGAVQAAPAAAEAASARTVLVVDDEEIVRRTTRSVLERKGYRVLLAENGQQAVEIFRERSGDLAGPARI